jgi:hypothetical protein
MAMQRTMSDWKGIYKGPAERHLVFEESQEPMDGEVNQAGSAKRQQPEIAAAQGI